MRLFIVFNILIITIVLIRAIAEGKISRKLQYAMWLVLPVFLIISSTISIPVNIALPQKPDVIKESNIQDMNSDALISNYPEHNNVYINSNEFIQSSKPSVIENSNQAIRIQVDEVEPVKSINVEISDNLSVESEKSNALDTKNVLIAVWALGAVVVGSLLVVNNIVFAKKVRRERRYFSISSYGNLEVYKLDNINSPFLFGRRIYINNDIEETSSKYEYATCHEYCHYKHGDMYWNILESLFITFLWFDPLIWMAFVLVKRDSEYAVDEHVVELLGAGKKADYSRALLDYSTCIYMNDSIFALSTSANGKSKSFIKSRIAGIMKGTKKSVSATLVITIALSGFVSCSILKPVESNVRAMEYVEDSEWFDTKLYETEKAEGFFGNYNAELLFLNDTDFIAVEKYNNLFDELDKISQYHITDSGECVLINTIDLNEAGLNYFSEDYVEVTGIYHMFVIEGKLYAVILNDYLDENREIQSECYIQEIDVANNRLGEIIRSDDITDVFRRRNNLLNQKWVYENNIYILLSTYDEISGTYYQRLVKLDKEFNKVQEKRISFQGKDMFFGELYQSGPDTAIFISSSMSGSSFAYRIDLDSFELEVIEDAPKSLFNSTWSTAAGAMYMTDYSGIYEYDSDINTINCVVDFNNCNVNRDDFNITTRAAASDNKMFYFTFIGSNNKAFYRLYEFTEAVSNPNVGKGIIKLANISGRNDLNEIVYQFNKNSKTAYVVYDDRYFVEDYMKNVDPTINSYNYTFTDEYKNSYRKAQNEVSNKLRVDIESGDGPDIIVSEDGFNELYNSTYCVDLKATLQDRNFINIEDYLPVIFNSDEVYQIPYWIYPRGILWNKRHEDQLDFDSLTYDEYDMLVSDVCNSKDPLSEFHNRNDYFLLIFNNQFNEFINEGAANINNDDFKRTAEFVKTKSKTNYINTDYTDPWLRNSYYSLEGSFTYTDLTHDMISGLPTASGECPISFIIMKSVAITSSCPMLDETCELTVAIMDSEQSIKIDSIRNRLTDSMNEKITLLEEHPEVFSDPNLSRLNGDEVDEYMDILMSADRFEVSDSDINVILIEEIQPYFAGDKTIEEVIPVMESRINLVLEERGADRIERLDK